MLLGREAERARIDDLIAAARLGDGATLVLRGEAGIGKTALLGYALGLANNLRVLRTRGIEAEAPLPYRGLHDLLVPLADRLEKVPAQQAEALRSALALGPRQEVHRL